MMVGKRLFVPDQSSASLLASRPPHLAALRQGAVIDLAKPASLLTAP